MTEGLKRRIARWLGYGGVEWPRSGIEDMPIVQPPVEIALLVIKVPVCCYPGGVQVLPGELGHTGFQRVLLQG